MIHSKPHIDHNVDKSKVLLIMFALIIDTLPVEEEVVKERMRPSQ